MSTFTTPLVVAQVGSYKWRLVIAFEYHIGSLPSEEVVRVPLGFITDFASVPRFLWSLIPPCGRHGKAAVVHDYLYRAHTLWVPRVLGERVVSRRRADAIFLEAMKVLGVPWWRRRAMYEAVRLCGRRAYRRGRTKNG